MAYNAYMCVCVCIYIYIYTHVHIYLYIYIYIYDISIVNIQSSSASNRRRGVSGAMGDLDLIHYVAALAGAAEMQKYIHICRNV